MSVSAQGTPPQSRGKLLPGQRGCAPVQHPPILSLNYKIDSFYLFFSVLFPSDAASRHKQVLFEQKKIVLH